MIGHPVDWLHNNFAMNTHLSAGGVSVEANQDDSAVITRYREYPVYRDLHDPYHLTEGGQLGRVHKGMKVLDISGKVTTPHDGTQRARGSDRMRALRAAFDPAVCYRDSPTTDGAYQIKFSERTLDTTNWPTGLIPVQYWARPARQPEVEEVQNQEGHRPFRVVLVAGDPRMYEQTERTQSFTPAAATFGLVNLGTEAAVLKQVITMSGAGHASFTLNRAGVSFILNLSGMTNGDVITVVHGFSAPYGRGRYILRNSTERADIKTSAASSWLDVPVGTTSFVMTNHTNVTSCVLRWYNSWV